MLPTIKSDSIYPLPNDVAIFNWHNKRWAYFIYPPQKFIVFYLNFKTQPQRQLTIFQSNH